VTLVFSAEETARKVAETLARKGIARTSEQEGGLPIHYDRRCRAVPAQGRALLQFPIAEVVSLAGLGAAT